MRTLKKWGIFTVVVVAFAAGSKVGVEYAKSVYVSKDRKFIEGEISTDKKDN